MSAPDPVPPTPATPMAPVAGASVKQLRRREIRAARRGAAGGRDRAADADAIASALSAALPAATGDRGGCVAVYRALPTEPPTDAVIAQLHGRGIPVIVPELLPDKDLDWRALRPDGSEGPTLGTDGIARATLVVTPALSVDRAGRRLGQGGGSYDRALRRRGAGSLVVAVVNDEEYVDGPLPSESHDALVDAVVTPGRGLVRLHGPT